MKPIAPSVLNAARLLLGAVFVYLGIMKAWDPVGFLKMVRAYHVINTAPALNVVAAVLPWFEVFCGLLLVFGLKARAAALLQVILLIGFTGVIVARGIALAPGGAFWSVRFDCGCGTGEVLVGLKVLENAGLILLAALVAAVPARRAGSQP